MGLDRKTFIIVVILDLTDKIPYHFNNGHLYSMLEDL